MVSGPFGRSFDPLKFSCASEVDGLCSPLVALVLARYDRVPGVGRIEYGVRCVCLNLFNVRISHPGAYVYFSRSPRSYTGWSVSYRLMMRIVAVFGELGLIESDTGVWGVDRPGTRSRMRALGPLVELFQKHKIRPGMVQTARAKRSIVLKDDDKRVVELPTDEASLVRVACMQGKLSRINDVIAESFIGLHISDTELHELALRMAGGDPPRYIDFSQKAMHRVFNNGSLEIGGRFVGGWWQNIPREYRKHIHIAHPGRHHARVAEIDYSFMHPAIAYAIEGVPLEGDPYVVDLVDSSTTPEDRQAVRKVAKAGLNILLNADSYESAVRALRSSLVDQRDANGVRLGESYLPPGCPPIDDLFQILLEKNEPIRGHMGTGAGKWLMNVESQIAERTMLRVLDDAGAVVLPLHDSFIVHKSYRDNLERYMLETFEEIMGQPCRVVRDPMESIESEADAPLDNVFRSIAEWEQEATTFFTMWYDWSYENQRVSASQISL